MGNKTYCVYMHTSPSGKAYIGITCQTPEYRWGQEGKGYVNCVAFFNAILKYGWDNIGHQILHRGLCEKEAKRTEVELIQKYRTQEKRFGYNLTAGGDGMSDPSPETRAKLSIARKGRQPTLGYHHTDEAKKKISEASKGNKYNVGRTLSEEHKRKIGEKSKGNKHCLGKHPTEETRRKLSLGHMGKVFSPEERAKIGESNAVAVNQYSMDGLFICRHISAVSAARNMTGKRGSHISDCCKGLRNSWHGFIWRYADEQERVST